MIIVTFADANRPWIYLAATREALATVLAEYDQHNIAYEVADAPAHLETHRVASRVSTAGGYLMISPRDLEAPPSVDRPKALWLSSQEFAELRATGHWPVGR